MLPYLTTQDVARDVDSIRASLHQPKISYYAFSYGTYLGEVYATLFPDRVRRMVLDSTVDPQGVWYADNIDQDYAFQGRMEAFFGWMARYSSTYNLGTTAAQVQQAWYTARKRLAAHPISGPNGPLIGPDEFDDTFLQGGYNNTYWPSLAQALSAYLVQNSANPMLTQYAQIGVQDENEFAIYNAVQCSDVNWPRNWAKWDSDTRKVYATAPFQAWDNAWFNAACAFWPVKGPAQPLKIGASGLPGDPHAAGHAGCRHAVRRGPGGAHSAADRADGGGPGQRQPRAVAGEPAGRLCPGLPQPLPGQRRPAQPAGSRQRHLRAPPGPDPGRLSRPRRRGHPRGPGHPRRPARQRSRSVIT